MRLTEIVFATRNAGKLRELEALTADLSIRFRSLAEFPGAPDVEETGTTFQANALLKAMAAYEHTGLPALADDSGLCVASLGGEPGVHSARYGGGDGDTARNNARLLAEMACYESVEERKAFFEATLVLVGPGDLLGPDAADVDRPRDLPPDASFHVFRGRTHGHILFEPLGDGGFGYDPLFFSTEVGRGFAELDMAEKNRVSHRGRAFAALHAFLVQRLT